jgi:hypothetical protein
MQLTHQLVEQSLMPLKGNTFQIDYDGSSQTHPDNSGIFGFFIERLFKIHPNSCRAADTEYAEIKTVKIEGNSFKSVSIGTIPESEYRKIRANNLTFEQSDPFKKMQKTLYIFYRKTYNEEYNLEFTIDSWIHMDMNFIHEFDKNALERDFQECVYAMKEQSYEDLSDSGCYRPKTKFLQLTYKGNSYYKYPSWKFSSAWMKKIYNLATKIS